MTDLEQWTLARLAAADERACRGADLEVFYPSGRGDRCVEALQLCRACELRQVCLELAMEQSSYRDIGGIWGGTSEHARRAVREGRISLEEAMARGDRVADTYCGGTTS